jgi:hypothetical protein
MRRQTQVVKLQYKSNNNGFSICKSSQTPLSCSDLLKVIGRTWDGQRSATNGNFIIAMRKQNTGSQIVTWIRRQRVPYIANRHKLFRKWWASRSNLLKAIHALEIPTIENSKCAIRKKQRLSNCNTNLTTAGSLSGISSQNWIASCSEQRKAIGT